MGETTTTTETPAAEATVEKKAKGPGIGARAIELIREGKSNEDVFATVRAEFPEAKTTMSSINWYRNKLRGDGEKVPTARELKKAAAPAPAEKPKRSRKKAADAPAADAAPAASTAPAGEDMMA